MQLNPFPTPVVASFARRTIPTASGHVPVLARLPQITLPYVASRLTALPKPSAGETLRRPPMPRYVPLPGSTRALMPDSRPAGAIDPNEITSVTVHVRGTGDPDALAKK